MKKSNLEIFIKFFGWQGGTLQQVTNEINNKINDGDVFSPLDILLLSHMGIALVMLTIDEKRYFEIRNEIL